MEMLYITETYPQYSYNHKAEFYKQHQFASCAYENVGRNFPHPGFEYGGPHPHHFPGTFYNYSSCAKRGRAKGIEKFLMNTGNFSEVCGVPSPPRHLYYLLVTLGRLTSHETSLHLDIIGWHSVLVIN